MTSLHESRQPLSGGQQGQCGSHALAGFEGDHPAPGRAMLGHGSSWLVMIGDDRIDGG